MYGGLLAAFIIAISNLKSNFFKQESYYILDSV